MTIAQEAFEEWKRQHKIYLRVYTDQQMFELGFESGRLFELNKMIEEEKLVTKAKKEKTK